MSYKEKYLPNGIAQRFVFFYDVSKTTYLQQLADRDKHAAQDIAELEALIADIKEYRQDIAKRYGELSTMGYSDTLTIKREFDCWSKVVRFHVTVKRTYTDGTTGEISREDFTGKERRQAIARFEELKKQHPGIKAIKDLEKSYGEMNQQERDVWRAKKEAANA